MTQFLDELLCLGKRAVEGGAQPYRKRDGEEHSRRWEWDVAGRCTAPLFRDFFCRPTAKTRTVFIDPKDKEKPFWLDLWIRCRKCHECRCFKRSHWEQRAQQEFKAYVRTWFVTLTIDPAHMYMAEAQAIRKFDEGGGAPDCSSWEHYPQEKRDALVLGLLGKEVTLWLKRVRKASGPLRYLLVAEKGERRGRIHFHLLVHELDPTRPVLHATLEGRWKYGYSKVKLAKGIGAARYLCKYLVKSVIARVRASKDYGNPEAPMWAVQRRLGVAPTFATPGSPNTAYSHSSDADTGVTACPQKCPSKKGDNPDFPLYQGGLISEVSSSRLQRREFSNEPPPDPGGWLSNTTRELRSPDRLSYTS